MIRTLLVTEVTKVTPEGGTECQKIYGRYDAVKLNNDGWTITKTYKERYKMTDADFAKYGRRVE